MWKFAVLLSYDGTGFCGWQRQRGSAAGGDPSIQATIEDALRKITSEPELTVVGSGRTDSGVHALGQVAHFRIRRKEWPAETLRRGLNSALPWRIRALASSAVPLDFHAQRSAEKKQYSYYYQQGPVALPHALPYSRWIRKPLDLDAMNRAAADLVGEQDFKPFQSAGAKPGPTVRTIFEAEVLREPIQFPGRGTEANEAYAWVRIRLVGSGFLRQMVRGIAGTLLEVGENRREAGCIREILTTKDRKSVGPTAPGRGLWLEKVWYPAHFNI